MYFSSCTLSGPTLWTGTGSTRWSSVPLPPLNAPGGKRRGGTNHDLGSRPCPESPSAIVPSRREMGRPSGLGIGHLEQQAPGPVGMDDSPAGPSSMPPRRQPASPHSSGGLSSPPGTEDAGALPAYRLSSDWKESYGHPIVFVAPSQIPERLAKAGCYAYHGWLHQAHLRPFSAIRMCCFFHLPIRDISVFQEKRVGTAEQMSVFPFRISKPYGRLGQLDPIARQTSPFRAGKDSADGRAVPVVAFNVASSAVRCIVESQR